MGKYLDELRALLSVIARSGFTISSKKATRARPGDKFLGNVIGSGSRRADPDKLEAILALRFSKTKRQVRQVLGLLGHFQDYIANFARIANH